MISLRFLDQGTIKTSDIEIAQAAIDALTRKLATAVREKNLADRNVRSASNSAATDNRARGSLPALNKISEEAQRLIRSIETELKDAKTRLSQVENSMALKRAHSAASASSHPPGTRLFECVTPDERRVRHRHSSPEALSATLQPGYRVVAEVFGSNADNSGGVCAAIDGTVPSLMAGLLRANGKELISYLQANGYEPSKDCYND
jgi:hypothetical protein